MSRCKEDFDVESQWFTGDMKVRNKSNISVNSCMLLKVMKKNSII